MSDFSKHTVSDIIIEVTRDIARKLTKLNKLWVETFVLEFTNEIPDDNEDSTEDDVRNIRGDIVIEKVFGFYRTVRNDSDDVGNL